MSDIVITSNTTLIAVEAKTTTVQMSEGRAYVDGEVAAIAADVAAFDGRLDTQEALSATLRVESVAQVAALYNGSPATNLPCYFDYDGVKGSAGDFYVSRTLQLQRDGATTTLTDIGAASTEMSTHTKINLPSTSSLYFIYLALDGGSANARLKAVTGHAALPALNNGWLHICSIRGRRVYDEKFEIIKMSRFGAIHPRGPIVLDGDTLYLPGLFASSGDYGYSDSAYTGLFKQTYTIQSDVTTPVWVVLDRQAGTIREIVGSTRPQQPLFDVLLCRNNGQYMAGDYPILGKAFPGGSCANQSPTGKNNPDAAGYMLGRESSTVIAETVALSSLPNTAIATARGFTTGVRNSNAGVQASRGLMIYGGRVVGATPGTWVWAECWIHTDADNNFGNPTARLILESGAIAVVYENEEVGFSGFQLKQIPILDEDGNAVSSPRLAHFGGWGQVPVDATDVALVAAGTFGDETRSYTVFGVKYGVAPSKAWVASDDWGGVDTLRDNLEGMDRPVGLRPILFRNKIFSIEGRHQQLHTECLYSIRSENMDLITRLERLSPGPGWFNAKGRGGLPIAIDDARLGAAARLSVKSKKRRNAGYRQYVDLTHVRTMLADLAGKTPRIMIIGDSLTDVAGFGHRLKAILAECGVAGDILVGTRVNQERLTNADTPVSGVEINSETRAAKRLADYSCEGGNPDEKLVPILPGDEADYLTMTNNERLEINPFARQVSGGTSTYDKQRAWKQATEENEPALNFYEEEQAGHSPDPTEYYYYDCDRYIEVTGEDEPTIVFILGGTNEISDKQNGTNTLNPIGYIDRALRSMVPDIRAKWGCPVVVGVPGISSVRLMDKRWLMTEADGTPVGQAAWISTVIDYLDELDDPEVEFAPLYAYTDPDSIFWPIRTTDDAGLSGKLAFSNEAVHFMPGCSREQPAECAAAVLAPFIAAGP